MSATALAELPDDGPHYRVACPECDWIVSFGEIAGGERAHCPRCSRVLTAPKRNAESRALALALCAGILLLLANSFPFIQLESNGIERVMTLPRTVVELYDGGNATLALLVSGPIVGVPLVMIGTMIALLLLLRRGRYSASLVPLGRLLFALHPWNMGEVFLIGVLVSLVKLTDMATVEAGFAFWAYAGFVVAFVAALSHLDRFQVWRQIEACQA